MTSPAYSNKNKFFSFTSAFGIAPVALNAGFLAFYLVTGIYLPEDIQSFWVNSPALMYFIYPMGNIMIFYLCVAAQAMITAALMFGFAANKRTATAFFGLPVKRSSLFVSRYAAGLVMLLVTQAVYFGLMLYGNLAVFGSTGALWSGWFVMLGVTLVIMFVAYGVTVLMGMFAGTTAEALAFSAALQFLPPLALIFTQGLFSVFLYGNSWGETYNSWPVALDAAARFVQVGWFPVGGALFLEYFSAPLISDPGFRFMLFTVNVPPLITVIVWALIGAGVSALAYRAFKRYRAENSGSLGVNPALNKAVMFLVSFTAFMIALSGTSAGFGIGGILQKCLIALAVSLIAFTLCQFLLTLNLQRTFQLQSYRPYTLTAAPVAVLVLICATGGFGYRNYQPKPEEIEAAYITYTGSPDFIPGGGDTFGNFYLSGKKDADIFVRDFQSLDAYSPADSEAVLALHKELIDAGAGVFGGENERIKLQTHIRYYLKDGREVDRFYKTIPAGTAERYLSAVEGTEKVKDLTEKATELPKRYYEENPDAGNIIVTDGLLSNPVKIPAGDIQALLDAVQADINALSYEEKNFPQAPARTVICLPRHFINNSDELVEPAMENYSYSVIFMQGTYVTTSVNDASEVNKMTGFLTGPSTGALRFYLTDGWVNTLAFLNERGLYPGTASNAQASGANAANITAMYASKLDLMPDYETQSLYFRSYALSDKKPPASTQGAIVIQTGGSGAADVPVNATPVPADKLAELLQLARTNYAVCGGGYLIYADMPDEDGTRRVTLFVPESDAPDWLRE